MRPFVTKIVVAATVGVSGLSACALGQTTQVPTLQAPTTSIAVTPAATTKALVQQPGQSVVVEARVSPVRSAELTLPFPGLLITEVLVRAGDKVAQGDPLVRLDTRSLQLAVETAQAGLARAQADYNKLLEGATPAEVEQAKAQIAQAQAQLEQSQSKVTPQDIAAAEASLTEARTRLANLQAGPRPTDMQQAQAGLSAAQAELDQQRTALSAAKEQAQRVVDERANDVRAAQSAYSQSYWELQRYADNSSDPRASKNPRVRQLAATLDKAQLDLTNTESVLGRAKVDYEAAQKNEVAGIAAAESKVAAAQARVNQLLSGANPDDVASAQAAVAAAEANLAQLRGGSRPGEMAAADAAVSQAQARLEDLTSKPSEASLAQLQAAIQQSEVNLKQAELALERATLTAPMAGVVAAVNVAPGEVASATKTALVLADVTTWQLETQNLDDLSVVNVREGAPVKIKFYAIPGLELNGKVERIEPQGSDPQGQNKDQSQALYTVVITPERWDDRLRWNMPAQVTILPGR